MPILLTVDQPEVLAQLKSLEPTKVISDQFYHGLNFTLNLSTNNYNFDIF